MNTALLEGKVALITGAARGIGRAIAETFAEHGAHTVCTDVAAADIQAVAGGINGRGLPRAAHAPLDVANQAEVRRVTAWTIAEFGRIDILVNNAGVLRAHPVLDFPLDHWQLVFRVNVEGTFLCSQEVARHMVQAGVRGSIINMSSASGKKADREEAAYCASKSAIIGFTRVLALELGQYGIRANAILPGATDTEMLRGLLDQVPGVREELLAKTPLGRMAAPRDQANAAVFLASDLASHITGAQLVVSGGEFMET
jgi:NAD(P)-dependent dehydrogenase (short-subunit alcohol dehydrogenase family)